MIWIRVRSVHIIIILFARKCNCHFNNINSQWAGQKGSHRAPYEGALQCCTIVAHNTAENRPDNFPSYPPDNDQFIIAPMMSISGKEGWPWVTFNITHLLQLASLSNAIFTVRRSYASAVLGVVILSVCLSVWLSHACFVSDPKNLPAIFLYHMKGQSFYLNVIFCTVVQHLTRFQLT